MKLLGYLLAGLAVVSMAPSAHAGDDDHKHEGERHIDGKVTSFLYSCNMDFRATGKSVYIGLGWSNIHGKGEISCYDLLHGTTEILPIKVKAKGPGAGIGVTGLVLSGAVAGIGVEKGPEALLGHYVSVRGNAAVGVGAGGAVGLRVSRGGVTIDVSVQAESGLGAGVDLLWLDIEPDGERRIEPALPPSQPVNPQGPQSVIRSLPAAPPEGPAGTTAIAVSQEKTTTEKTNIVYLHEGEPLQILDGKGNVIQTIYLKAGTTQK